MYNLTAMGGISRKTFLRYGSGSALAALTPWSLGAFANGKHSPAAEMPASKRVYFINDGLHLSAEEYIVTLEGLSGA